jgi:hypothetical protein
MLMDNTQGEQSEPGAADSGGLDSNGVLSINKDGAVANFQPATSGQYTLVNFNSRANVGSDKGFILVQDESAQSPGTSTEDLRMTIGVHNDFYNPLLTPTSFGYRVVVVSVIMSGRGTVNSTPS